MASRIPRTRIPGTARITDIPVRGQAPLTTRGPLQQAFGEIAQQRRIETERQEAEKAAEQAIVQQTEAGIGNLVQPGANLSDQARRVFIERSRQVHRIQSIRQARQVALQGFQENINNPQSFQEFYTQFAEGVEDQLAETDPLHAAQIRLELDEVGAQTLQNLIQDQANLERAREVSDYKANLEGFQNDVMRELIANPNEQNLMQAQAQMSRLYAQGQTEQGGFVLSPDEARVGLRQATTDVISTFVMAKAQQALQRGDPASVQSLINKLNNGAYFPDPADSLTMGSRLANQLKSWQSAARSAQAGNVSMAMSQLQFLNDASENGQPVNREDFSNALGLVNAYGTRAQRTAANRIFADANVKQEWQQRTQMMSLNAVNGSREAIANNVAEGRISGDAGSFMIKSLDRRQKELMNFKNSGKFLDSQPRLSILQNSQQDFLARRNNASQVLDESVDKIPVFRDDEIQEVNQQYISAVRNNDTNTATQIANSFLQKAGGQYSLWSSAIQSTEQATPLYLAAMAGIVNPDMAGSLSAAIAAGQNRQGEEFRTSIQDTDLGDTNRKKLMRALSLGNPEIAGQLENLFVQAANGLIAQQALGQQEAIRVGGVPQQIEGLQSLLQPMLDNIVTLPNGQFMLASAANISTKDGRLLEEVINEQLASPQEMLGLPADSPEINSLVPIPLGSGAVGWLDASQNRRILVGEDGNPIFLDAPREVEEAKELEQLEDGGFFNLKSSVNREAQDASIIQLRGAKVERNLKLPQGVMEALFSAVQATPSVERGGFGPLNSPEPPFEKTAPVPSQFRSQNPAFNQMSFSDSVTQSGHQLKDRLNRYKDLETALVAYALGDEFDSLFDQVGKDWRKFAPESAQAFAQRVIDRIEKDE